jgi:hypothetical protein
MYLHMLIFYPISDWLGLVFGIVLHVILTHWHEAFQHLLITHGLSFFPAVHVN